MFEALDWCNALRRRGYSANFWDGVTNPVPLRRKGEFGRPDKRSASGSYAVDALCLSTLPTIHFLGLTALALFGEENCLNALWGSLITAFKIFNWVYFSGALKRLGAGRDMHIPSLMFEALDWRNALRSRVVCKLLGRGYKPRPAQT